MNDTYRHIETYIETGWEKTCPPPRGNHIPNPHRYVTSAVEGHLQHLFYWDAYFSGIGLLMQDRIDLAQSTLEAQVHLFNLKGFVPNVDMPGGDNRTQLPFLSHFVRLVYEYTGDKQWLADKVSILKNEYIFWMTDRAAPIAGLNRFRHNADEAYLRDFYRDCLCPRLGFDPDVSDAETLRVGSHYLTEAESTADFTSRFMGRANDFMAIDLNANLYGYETHFAWFAQELGRSEESTFWQQRAKVRKAQYIRTFWDASRGSFFDWDVTHQAFTPVWTPMAFTALWNGLADPEHAQCMVDTLPKLETNHGLMATDAMHLGIPMQWDAPFGWPPHQYLVVHGLLKYGFKEDALRLADKFLTLMVQVFEDTGELWEKYDVVDGGLKSSEYDVQTQMGWSAAVFLDFKALLHNTD